MQRAPTAQELAQVLEQYVKDEIYFRESKRLGLDVNDTIVRRRMVQKLTFLTEDIVLATPIDDDALSNYLAEHQDQYRVAPRFSFSHRYFSVDRREDAEQDARVALTNEDRGDPFMLDKKYELLTERRIGDLFGRAFAAEVAKLQPADEPQGPYESAYGWHVVTLTEVAPGHVPDLADIRERVESDAKQAARAQANDAYYQDLLTRYSVVYPDAVETPQ